MFKKDHIVTPDEFNSMAEVLENVLGINLDDTSKASKILKNSITKTFGEGGDFSSLKDIEDFINDNVFDQNTYLNVIFKPGTYHETITNGVLLNIEGSYLTFNTDGTGDVDIIIDSSDVDNFTAILIQSRSIFVTKNITFIDGTGSNKSVMIMASKDSVVTALDTEIKTGGIGIFAQNFSKIYTLRYRHDSLDISGGTAIRVRYKSELMAYFSINVNEGKKYENKISSVIDAQVSSSVSLFYFTSSSIAITDYFLIGYDSECYVYNTSDLDISPDNVLAIMSNSKFYSNKSISGIDNYNTIFEDGSVVLTPEGSSKDDKLTFITFNNAIEIKKNGIIKSIQDLQVDDMDSYDDNTYITIKYLEEKRPIKNRTVEVFDGDNSITDYTLKYDIVENAELDVYINGILKLEDEGSGGDYTFFIDKNSGSPVVSFNNAPLSTDKIVFKYWFTEASSGNK